VITLNDVTCYWDEGKGGVDDVEIDDSRAVALRKINLSLKKNELTFIVGAVGCGKSALLYALAGELLPDHGQITRSYSTLAYAAQNPWIMNGT
jgi:ABC-type nitrate/sulfonate/bicarbonate transport system ATPase subunit